MGNSFVSLSLMSSEIQLILHVLSQETSEAASTLWGKLLGLIDIEDGADSESDEAAEGEFNHFIFSVSCSLAPSFSSRYFSWRSSSVSPSPCPRNGIALHAQGQWWASGVFSRGPNVTSDTLISALASAHYGSPFEGPVLWVQSVRHILARDPGTFEGNNSLIACCQYLSSKDIGCRFLQLLLTVQLTFKCQQ